MRNDYNGHKDCPLFLIPCCPHNQVLPDFTQHFKQMGWGDYSFSTPLPITHTRVQGGEEGTGLELVRTLYSPDPLDAISISIKSSGFSALYNFSSIFYRTILHLKNRSTILSSVKSLPTFCCSVFMPLRTCLAPPSVNYYLPGINTFFKIFPILIQIQFGVK